MTETESVADKYRAASRLYYVKTHAPGILAALICQPLVVSEQMRQLGMMPAQHSLAQLRAQAIEQAGLLFDELEPK